jgi:hypothetical protein
MERLMTKGQSCKGDERKMREMGGGKNMKVENG